MRVYRRLEQVSFWLSLVVLLHCCFCCLCTPSAWGHSQYRHEARARDSSSSPPLRAASPGTWTPLVNAPPFAEGTGGAAWPVLLTDGSVLVLNQGVGGGTNEVWKLVPDGNGSYVNGEWKAVAPFPDYRGAPFSPSGFASAVLPDGRVIFAGGEYNALNRTREEADMVALYDPFADRWETIPPPPFCQLQPNLADLVHLPGGAPGTPLIGDAPSVVLEDGTFMLGCSWDHKSALLDLHTKTWTPTGAHKLGSNHEEGWVLLPDGTVLVVDLYVGVKGVPHRRQLGTEIFYPPKGKWRKAADLQEPISNPFRSSPPYPDHEVGPTCLRPDGTVFAFGGDNLGTNAIYDTKAKCWKKGPRFPFVEGSGKITTSDAALLPSGHVLVYGGMHHENSSLPCSFWELTLDNEFIPVPAYPVTDPVLLTLPTGQVLSVDRTNDVRVYTPGDRYYRKEWAPAIYDVPEEVFPGETYRITGKRFNGVSQGCTVGDSNQKASNYPIVRMTNARTGRVFYSATHHHSYMGVASNRQVHTYFDVPPNILTGATLVQVIANGIPSYPYAINVHARPGETVS